MLKKLGNIFKSDLPPNILGTVIPTTTDTTTPNFFGVLNFNKILANYTRYEKNINIFRSFIQIDTVKAAELNLSYFKTITINKFQNSKWNTIQNSGYTGLLDENQTVNIKNFISNDTVNRNFDLVKNDILGRDLNLNATYNKFSVENFTSRKAYNYNSGLTVDSSLNVSQYQDLFFELNFSTNLKVANSNLFPSFSNITKYDLIIYAMNSNDEIIDVKKIENFDTSIINWNVDSTTLLYNIDDVEFDRLLNMTFDSVVFNNLRRKFYINTTQYCKDIKQQLGFFPIETISIQEDSNPIEIQLDKINIENVFASTDKIALTCENDLSDLSAPVNLTYKIFMKIAGMNSYVIKSFVNTISDQSALSLISQQQKFQNFLNHTTVKYLTNLNLIKVDLSLLNVAFNDNNFNPKISSIFINNDTFKDYAAQTFTFLPSSDSFANLNLQGNALKDVVTISSNLTENILTFYLRNYANNPLSLKFIFEQNFEIYEVNFPIETIYSTVNYEQSLTINNNNLTTKDFSNLNIEYLIKIKNFKNSNTNLNRYLSLNYENIFLQELQTGTQQLSRDFENNIFVIIKKSIYQEKIHVKDKYYIFNKDINFDNLQLQLQTETDLNLKLNFNDNVQINRFFFKRNQFDNLDVKKNVKYVFEARIMIIPIGFFITTYDYATKQRIKELLCLNNFQNSLPSENKLIEIFEILKKINDNKFSDLNQIYLYKLYNEFCLKDTQASNEILLSINNTVNIPNSNKLNFKNINYNLLRNATGKSLRFNINFDASLKNSSNENFTLLLSKLSNIFNSFYFKDNNSYIEISQIIPEFTSLELKRELNKNLSYVFNINSNSATIVASLDLTPELSRFFNFAYTRSTLDFAPYNLDFLNNNLYVKLELPTSLSNNNDSDIIEFFDINTDAQYCLLNFYDFLI
jgi:hypothetical protein